MKNMSRTDSWFNSMSAEENAPNCASGPTKRATEVPATERKVNEHSRFSCSLLESYLYGKNRVSAIDIKKRRQERTPEMNSHEEETKTDRSSSSEAFDVCSGTKEGHCAPHGPLESLRQLVHAKDQEKPCDDIKPTYAVLSFPDEVQLCTSSIPGHKYGVCAKQHLPSGTWIGPYEGRRTVDLPSVGKNETRDHWWEIYKEGKSSHFIDGTDENFSSWMRFIRCARNAKEQNMSAFQYGQNIYYRSFRDIAVGEELLVWYSDDYLKHLGIPVGLKETEQGTSEGPAENRNEERATTNFPANAVAAPCPTNHNAPFLAAPKPYSRHSPPSSECAHGLQVGKSTEMHSFHSFEIVAPTIQQTLAHQIKERRERIQSYPNELTSSYKEVLEGSTRRLLKFNEKDSREYCSEADTTESRMKEDFMPVALNDLSSPFKCRQCLKVFTQRIQLQMHVCPKSPYKPFQCGHCSMSFALPSELRSHVVVHTSERPFKCGFCGRSFAGATTLNNHVRTHTGEKPFVCNNCGKTFSIATQLSRHARVPGECVGHVTSSSCKHSINSVFEHKQA